MFTMASVFTRPEVTMEGDVMCDVMHDVMYAVMYDIMCKAYITFKV